MEGILEVTNNLLRLSVNYDRITRCGIHNMLSNVTS